MQPEEFPSILTLKQASGLLNCHPNTLRKWEQQGIVKCYRFGSRGDRRFRKEDILALLKNNDLNQQH